MGLGLGLRRGRVARGVWRVVSVACGVWRLRISSSSSSVQPLRTSAAAAACSDAACAVAARLSSAITPSPPLAPTYLLVYRNQDDYSGQYSLKVTLDHSSHNGCTNCWDRCAAGISGASYRIVGPGQVAIAWNSIGAYSYASAGFDRGGYARTQDSGCLKSQGGGAFNLCHSASFTGANATDHENALSAVCSP